MPPEEEPGDDDASQRRHDPAHLQREWNDPRFDGSALSLATYAGCRRESTHEGRAPPLGCCRALGLLSAWDGDDAAVTDEGAAAWDCLLDMKVAADGFGVDEVAVDVLFGLKPRIAAPSGVNSLMKLDVHRPMQRTGDGSSRFGLVSP